MADPNIQNVEWQTPNYRSMIVNRIEEQMKNSGTQMQKSSREMEEYVFQKARSREEYLDLVARLLISVKEHNAKDKKMAGGQVMQQGQPGMMQPGMGQPNMAPGGPMMMRGGQMMQHPRHMVQRPQLNAMQGAQGGPMVAGNMNYPHHGARMPGGPYMQGRDGMQHMAMGPVQGSPGGMPITSPHSNMSVGSVGNIMSPPMRPPMSGVPSPSTVMLNTPGNAIPNPSPIPPNTSEQEMAYLKKLEDLSKYIEPLRKNIQELEKKTDEESKKNQKKLRGLLEILSDPKKRVSIEILEKYGQLLKKVNMPNTNTNTGHMCQPLLDAVAQFSSASHLNHSLYRTFGPALEAYMGPPIKAPPPPASRKRKSDPSGTTPGTPATPPASEELPDVLQGEIARLGSRFVVSVDPRHHPGSQAHHLVCRLEDHRLPSVPPIMVTVPKTYPRSSPQCSPDSCPGYDATEYFQSCCANLAVHISQLPARFSLTQLLTCWEMSVRKACDPRSPTIAQPNPVYVA